MATVTLSLEEVDDLRARERVALEECAELKRQLADARMHDPSGRVRALNTLAREMLEIVRFAVANLPPIEIRGWPWRAIQTIALGLSVMPDFSDDDKTLVVELKGFSEEIRNNELLAARTREAQIDSIKAQIDSMSKSEPKGVD